MLEVHICNQDGSVLRAFALGDSKEVLVGRDEGCDIQIRSAAVSREHCSIEQDDDDGFRLRDLGSKAGTLVNGERVETAKIEDGLEITIGPAVLKFFENDI